MAHSDGAYIDSDNNCVGVGNGGSTKVYAKATCGCSGSEISSVVSDSKYLDSQTVTASCPEGSTATSCNCQSAWKVKTCNNEATFAPEGGVCSQAIGRSGGRRRGSGGGAGAKVYAVCSSDTTPEEEEPVIETSSPTSAPPAAPTTSSPTSAPTAAPTTAAPN